MAEADDTAKARLLEEMVSMIAHDLRGPISGAKMHAQLLVNDTFRMPNDMGEGARRHARAMNRLLDQMLRMTETLLDASLADNGELSLNLQMNDTVNELLNILEDFIPQAQVRGIIVRVDAPDPPVFASYDRDRIRQVLGNLLGNALKFAPGSSQMMVRLYREDEHNTVVFAVESRGPVIPEEERERVFERFAKMQKRTPGLGLGLWISKWIVESHGGKIWVEPHEGGNRFVFTLPMAPPPPKSTSNLA